MKTKITIAISCICLSLTAQPPTGSPPTPLVATNPNQAVTHANFAWYRGGNFNVGPAGNNNIFGTMWNSPIYTVTDGITRMRLNGTLPTAPIWGVTQNVSGYIGIDPTGFFNNNVPQTMLHLHSSNVPVFTTGWRRWMKTGIFMEENSDAMYVGLKTEAISNQSDAVINWSDDAANGPGPDKLRFIFTGSTPTGNGSNFSPIDVNGLNGYEFMRMQPFPTTINSSGNPIGHVGIGPVFTNALPPQNRLHINSEENIGAFVQISNASGTGQTNLDGFKFGYATTSATNLTANINQMENDKLLVFTNNAERIRISHIGNISTPNMNPGGLANNLTRVSISHDPANPVTKPLSLLHLGYNTGSIINPNNTDGWRPWMDVGMFVAQSSDNVYLGLKNESTTPLGDKYDAVLSWGDNQINSGLPPNNGPDNFRFIFTSSTTGSAGGTAPATGPDGLEGMRLTPTTANGVYTGIGGAPTVNPYTAGLNAGNTLEINSWGATNSTGGSSGLRFTNLNTSSPVLATNPGPGVLAVDANGDVIYVDKGSIGVGNYCSSSPNALTGDYEIPLATYNYYFSGQGTGRTNVGFGLPCNTNLGGKVHAYQLANNFFFGSNLGVSVAGRFDNYTSVNAYLGYGVVGNAAGNTSAWNIGVYGTAANAGSSNFAGYFDGDVYTSGGTNSIAGYLSGSDKNIKTDVNNLRSSLEIISRLKPVSFKFDNTYAPQLKLNSTKNYGFIAQDVEKILPDIVVTSTVLPTFDSTGSIINPAKELKSLNYDGLIPFAIGGIQELNARQKEMQANIDKLNLSDAQVKTNVNTFNALATVKTLSPVKYNFTNANVPQLSFKPNTDYGFIAQQLETVYPELVDTIRVEATYDSLGTVVNPSKVLKTVNYKAMSALLVRSVQEQQQTIDSLRNTQNAILQQLAALASQINSCCSNTTAARQSNSNINQLDIELSDKDAIVLNQNVPNPFAEQTTITYNVPSSVEKAQLIFFNSNGQVIQTVDIKTRGKGKVNVFAADLSSGLYHYSLIADGKVVDSKKMVRE